MLHCRRRATDTRHARDLENFLFHVVIRSFVVAVEKIRSRSATERLRTRGVPPCAESYSERGWAACQTDTALPTCRSPTTCPGTMPLRSR